MIAELAKNCLQNFSFDQMCQKVNLLSWPTANVESARGTFFAFLFLLRSWGKREMGDYNGSYEQD